ncbi:MAG: phage tail assembly protein [Pseudohongiella sp.]|nr:phage tail assembly protein [Pseudohongiella sp.]
MDKTNTAGELSDQPAAETKKTASSVQTQTIELDTPITRGSKTINHVDLRKPLAGALRGVALVDVLQMDVVALTTVLPRITDPALTEADIRNMDPADLVQMGAALTEFVTAKKFKLPVT